MLINVSTEYRFMSFEINSVDDIEITDNDFLCIKDKDNKITCINMKTILFYTIQSID